MKQSLALSAAGRLEAIAPSSLLEMGSLPAVDRIVRAAAELLGAPVAQVNVLTADGQIPIGHIGGEPWSHGVPFERSVCKHVITSGEPLVVRDAREHPLLRESPAAIQNGIAAYLSVPIHGPRTTDTIATLCVMDFHPRDWSETDVRRLTDLSSWAGSEIELRAEHRALRLQSDAALQASETRLRLALESAQLGAWDLDLANGRMECTPQCKANFGRGSGERFDYADLLEVIHPEDRAEVRAEVEHALAERTDYEAEYRALWPDGTEHWISARGTASYDTEGNAFRMTGVTQDVTERKRIDEELHRAKSKAEEASRTKSQFLAVMSHELRTPLNAILGYADLLLAETKGPITAGQEAQIERINQSGRHLLKLIEEILTYARLEAGKEEVRLGTADAARLVRDAAEMVRPITDQKGLELRLDIPDQPLPIVTDRRKMRQVLLNLLANAAKFTDRGEVAVAAVAEHESVRIDVSDTGPGIRSDQIEAIWEPFRQAPASLTREKGGTGLGLSVSLELARLLGGEITVESAVGEGSTFTFRLPLRPHFVEPAREIPPAGARPPI